jgi:hypothetical protein
MVSWSHRKDKTELNDLRATKVLIVRMIQLCLYNKYIFYSLKPFVKQLCDGLSLIPIKNNVRLVISSDY